MFPRKGLFRFSSIIPLLYSVSCRLWPATGWSTSAKLMISCPQKGRGASHPSDAATVTRKYEPGSSGSQAPVNRGHYWWRVWGVIRS